MRGPFLWLVNATGFLLKLGVTNLTADKALNIDAAAIGADKIARIGGDGTTLTFVDAGTLGGGTVTSVAVGANATSVLDIANASSTPTITLDNQAANVVFAGPGSGGAVAPTFRALVAADIPSLDANKITTGTVAYLRLPVGTAANTVAAGNDTRFHTRNADTGTTVASFQIDSSNTGPRIKNESGILSVRNAADTAYASLIVQELTVVGGTTTTINTEEVLIADNILTLNSNFTTGSPTENAGFTVLRGGSASADFLWDEGTDRFVAGLTGATLPVALKKKITFINGDLTAGKLTVTHNLNEAQPFVQIWLANGYSLSADIKTVNVNTIEIDFGGAVATGTHTVTVIA